MDGSTILVPVGDMTAVAVQEALFVYDEDAHRFFRLNWSAAEIYERCDGRVSVGDIAEALAQAHPDAAGQVRADVLDMAQGLIELGLVTVADGDGPGLQP